MSLRESPRRTRLAASGLLLFTFAAGCIMGAAGSRVITARAVSAAPADTGRIVSSNSKGSRGTRAFFVDPKILDEIGVSGKQRVAIDSILEQRGQEANHMWKDWETRWDAAMQQTRGQVRSLLTEEQGEKLTKAIAERRARRKAAQDSAQAGKSDRDHAHENHDLLFPEN